MYKNPLETYRDIKKSKPYQLRKGVKTLYERSEEGSVLAIVISCCIVEK
jgi:hypothetical protein